MVYFGRDGCLNWLSCLRHKGIGKQTPQTLIHPLRKNQFRVIDSDLKGVSSVPLPGSWKYQRKLCRCSINEYVHLEPWTVATFCKWAKHLERPSICLRLKAKSKDGGWKCFPSLTVRVVVVRVGKAELLCSVNSVTSLPPAQGGSSPSSGRSTIDRSQAGGAAAIAITTVTATTVPAALKLEKQQFAPKIRHPHGDCKQDID